MKLLSADLWKTFARGGNSKHCAFFYCILLFASILTGCRDKSLPLSSTNPSPAKASGVEPSDVANSAARSSALKPSVAATTVTKHETSNETLPVLPSGVKDPTAGDPKAEGWEAEAFSEVALRQLQALGERIQESGPSGVSVDRLEDLVSDDFQAVSLLPANWKIVLQDGPLTVERATQVNTPASKNMADIFAPLTNRFAKFQHRKTKFKLYRVERHEGHPQSRQYVHLSGSSDSEASEYNATWIVDWDYLSDDQPPRIRSIAVERAEIVSVPRNGQPWLVDSTESLLPESDALQECLSHGIDYWESRLDTSCGVYNLGYHGVAVADVNGDQLEDIYVCQTGGLPNHLLLQQPDGSVREEAAMANVDYLDNTRSAMLVDLDNDDDADLILAMATGLLFLENDGHGRFTERAQINGVREAFSLAVADYNQDGWLDIYVCVYYGQGDDATRLPLPIPYFDATNGGANHLIRNRGGWQFEDATAEVGLDQENNRFSFAAIWEDFDQDGDLDLFVVNDFGQNQLYRNDRGRFTNVAREAGLNDGAFGMSATVADYDHDGDQDIYVSNMFSAAGNRVTFDPRFKPDESPLTRARFQHLARGNSLFQNQGNGTFADVSVPMNVTMGRWSWGSMFVDVNNDSWDDLFVANGFITGRQEDDL